MRLLYVSDIEPDPLKGASGCDLQMLGAMRARGHEVEEVWSVSRPGRIRHPNLHLLFEAPACAVRAIEERTRDHRPYDAILVSQPFGYRAAAAHRRAGRPGVFLARSHGWELHVRDVSRRHLVNVDDRRGWRRAASAALVPLLERQNRVLLGACDGVVLGSTEDAAYVSRQGIDASRVLPLAPGLPEGFLDTAAPPMTAERARRLLYVGQFAAIKAPDVVAAAASLVLEKSAAASMTWVCAREHHARARALIAENVRDRVTFLDWMSRPALRAVYDQHGLFLFPSYFEGFGQTFLEAMARGLVVLASRAGGMRDVIRDGENGFLFTPGDANTLAARALALAGDASLCGALGSRARADVAAFTWRNGAAKLEGFVDELLRLRGRASRPAA